MSLSKDAQDYLDGFDLYDPDGRERRDLWDRISYDERKEIFSVLSERTHSKNADHAETILRSLPKKWRDDVILRRIKDVP